MADLLVALGVAEYTKLVITGNNRIKLVLVGLQGMVKNFVMHGVLHSEPIILHYQNNNSGRMIEGQTFNIKPILTMGSIDCIA